MKIIRITGNSANVGTYTAVESDLLGNDVSQSPCEVTNLGENAHDLPVGHLAIAHEVAPGKYVTDTFRVCA